MNRKRPRSYCPCGAVCETSWKQKYCSTTCSGRYRSQFVVDEWLTGGPGADKNGELLTGIRRFLIEEAGNRCTRCGWSRINPVSGLVTLTVDHVDGDIFNASRSNLVVLCYNCHTLTPTFNNLNRGKATRYDTPGRRQRAFGQAG